MHSVYEGKKNCCGCGVCSVACPRHCIEMRPDEEGFLYPAISEERCVDCSVCRSVCPVLNEGNFKEKTCDAFYAARHRSTDVLESSTSGGAFTAVSDWMLDRGGVVYGVDFDGDFMTFHGRATNKPGRDRFRISKYVQSKVHPAFARVLADLGAGRDVLFTGTPCQTAAVRGLTSKKSTKKYSGRLYTCDVICHSIPSPLIWASYKELLERENKARLIDVAFRTKARDWTRANSNRGFRYLAENAVDYKYDDRFYDLWMYASAIARPSCYSCRYTDSARPSDITIADYWGIEKYDPDFYDPRGVSLVMVNTEAGREIASHLSREMEMVQRPASESLVEQGRLSKPAERPANRDEFWRDYLAGGLESVLEKYLPKAKTGR